MQPVVVARNEAAGNVMQLNKLVAPQEYHNRQSEKQLPFQGCMLRLLL